MANNFLDEKGREKMFKKIADIHNKAMAGLSAEQKRQYVAALQTQYLCR